MQEITGTDLTGTGDRETFQRSRRNQEARIERFPLPPASLAQVRTSVRRDGRLPSQGTEGCNACGRLAKAPVHGTYMPSGDVVYQWRCSECGNSWQTSVYPATVTDGQPGYADLLPENTAH
jgi:hypothetical protein